MTFARPEALWLTLLAPVAPVVVAWLWHRHLRALAAWASAALWDRLDLDYSQRRLTVSILALAFAVLGTTLALARPQWGSSEEMVERKGVDVVFILDSSLSMQARDVAPSRLEIGKALVRQLIVAMPGNRTALVQTEGKGVVLSPLTVDSAVIDLLLDTVLPGSLPDPGTRLDSALTEALDLFPPESEKHRVVVIVSDGEDHGSEWKKALDKLIEGGVVIHALGTGTRGGTPILIGDGGTPLYKQDSQGNVVVTRLEPTVLERLAGESGGIFVEVDSPVVDAEPLLSAITSMEKRTLSGEILEVAAERFQWPLAAAVVSLVLLLAVPPLSSIRSTGRQAS
jgi:Ca-activated chloride channel family protein